MNKTIMHINYGELEGHVYGKKSVDDICRMAKEIGFDGIEFRGVPPRELKHLSFREYAKQIADGKKKYGLTDMLLSIGIADCTSTDHGVREKAIAEAIEHTKIASEVCGTTHCNTAASFITSKITTAPKTQFEFHGSAAVTEEEWKLTVDAYQRLGAEAEKLGVKFGFETHMNYIHDLPHQVMKLVNLIDSPAIGVNMDYGNTVYFNDRPSVEETIDIYGDKLFYTHLKNSMPIPGGRVATALGDGEINHRVYLEKLREVGFDGPIGIEAPRSGDRVWYAKCDYEYYRSVMEDIQRGY